MLVSLAIIVFAIISLFLAGVYFVKIGITKDHKLLIEAMETKRAKARFAALGLEDKNAQMKCASVEIILSGILLIAGAIEIAVFVFTY